MGPFFVNSCEMNKYYGKHAINQRYVSFAIGFDSFSKNVVHILPSLPQFLSSSSSFFFFFALLVLSHFLQYFFQCASTYHCRLFDSVQCDKNANYTLASTIVRTWYTIGQIITVIKYSEGDTWFSLVSSSALLHHHCHLDMKSKHRCWSNWWQTYSNCICSSSSSSSSSSTKSYWNPNQTKPKQRACCSRNDSKAANNKL